MAAETGLQIDGKILELPTRDSFDLDEWQVMYDYAGLGITDFVPPAEDEPEESLRERQQKFKNPAVLRALLHIAYQRANPDLPAAKVGQLVGKINALEALEHLGTDEEDDAVPPASTSEPGNSSPNGSLENVTSSSPGNETPATGSSQSSDGQAGLRSVTTGGTSDTSFISAHEISAA